MKENKYIYSANDPVTNACAKANDSNDSMQKGITHIKAKNDGQVRLAIIQSINPKEFGEISYLDGPMRTVLDDIYTLLETNTMIKGVAKTETGEEKEVIGFTPEMLIYLENGFNKNICISPKRKEEIELVIARLNNAVINIDSKYVKEIDVKGRKIDFKTCQTKSKLLVTNYAKFKVGNGSWVDGYYLLSEPIIYSIMKRNHMNQFISIPKELLVIDKGTMSSTEDAFIYRHLINRVFQINNKHSKIENCNIAYFQQDQFGKEVGLFKQLGVEFKEEKTQADKYYNQNQRKKRHKQISSICEDLIKKGLIKSYKPYYFPKTHSIKGIKIEVE